MALGVGIMCGTALQCSQNFGAMVVRNCRGSLGRRGARVAGLVAQVALPLLTLQRMANSPLIKGAAYNRFAAGLALGMALSAIYKNRQAIRLDFFRNPSSSA